MSLHPDAAFPSSKHTKSINKVQPPSRLRYHHHHLLFFVITLSWHFFIPTSSFVIPHKCHQRQLSPSIRLVSSHLNLKRKQTETLPGINTKQQEISPPPEGKGPDSLSEKTLGALVLLTVPVSWGTFAPAVKYVYDLPVPIPGFVFSALYYFVAAGTLLSLNTLFERSGDEFPIRGGVELGSYLFLGNCLQVVGLESIPADRAAFLVQLTTVFVPLYQGIILGKAISTRTWLACILAFLGVIVMGLDDGGASATAASSAVDISWTGVWDTIQRGMVLKTGDGLVILAAMAYTLHVVRLDKFAKDTTPLKLAAVKSVTETLLATSVVGLLLYLPSSSYHEPIVQFLQTPNNIPPLAIFSICWTGIVTCGYTIYAQSFGQKRLQNAVTANLIYTSQPLFSAMFAYGLLGETMEFVGVVGGVLIAIALGMIALETGDE